MKNLFILLTLSLTLGTAAAATYIIDGDNLFKIHKIGGNNDGRGLEPAYLDSKK